MTTGAEVRLAHQALLDGAMRLADERDDVPAGAVLRSYSRAVRMARISGCPLARLPLEADRLARWLLETRVDVSRSSRG